MQLAYATDSLRELCVAQSALVAVWGEMWSHVAKCLLLVDAAGTLADIAAFAAFTVLVMRGPALNMTMFIVSNGVAELHLHPIDGEGRQIAVPGNDDDALAFVKFVRLANVYCAGRAAEQAVGA